MATINGCNIPDDLYYLTEKHVWARPESGGLVTIGMSDVAQHLAGNILSLTAKKVGRNVPKGQSVATIESAKWVGPVPAPVSGEIVEINEAARATTEGVVRSARDGDIGAIFGFGFPPFRGGPLRMIDALGAAEVVRVLEELAAAHGTRFSPAEGLVEMGKKGGRFYSD